MSQMTTKPNPSDLLDQMGVNVYREAYKSGQSLSAFLEKNDPSDQYNDGLDAFGRLIKAAGIRTRALPEHGVAASTWDEFNKNDKTRALIPEWAARIWRSVSYGQGYSTRALYQSADATGGSWERPYSEAAEARASQQIAPAIPLSAVVGQVTNIDSDLYRAYYLTYDETASGMSRVTEGAEIPRVKLAGGERTVNIYKYGRALEATYEQLRWQKVDKVARHIAMMAIQTEIDKLADAITVLVNGDGNSGTAATSFNLTTLDSGTTASNLTLKAWLALKMKLANPYMATTALANDAIALALMMLNTGSGNVPLVQVAQPSGFGYFSQINSGLRDNVQLGWTSAAPANKVVVFDQRFALEMVTEIGGNISEVEKFVTRQTQALTLTEMVGWAIMDPNATKILVYNA